LELSRFVGMYGRNKRKEQNVEKRLTAPSGRALLDIPAGSDLDGRLVVGCGRAHAFLTPTSVLVTVVHSYIDCTLICLAIVKKACSTLVAFFAEVSKNGIPRLSANS
jgi:hypothetical protein